MEDKTYLTPQELAARLKVTVATLRTWRFRGQGPDYYHMGNQHQGLIRYDKKDIEKYEEERRIKLEKKK